MAKSEQTAPPITTGEEQTGRQTHGSMIGQGGVGSFMGGDNLPKPPAGSFDTYRKMRRHPTIALARMVATAPIRTAAWSVEADDDAPEDRMTFVQRQLESLWPRFIQDVMFSLDYGFQAFEKVWTVAVVDGRQRLVYKKLKPLMPDKTEILGDSKTGAFAGVRQDQVELPVESCFLYTNELEGQDYYGQSRHENCRETSWHTWMETSRKLQKYVDKVAGVIPVIEYPEGQSQDESGAIKSNFDLAKSVLNSLGKGNGVAMPNIFSQYAQDLARAGVDLKELKAWHIDFLETKAAHGDELLSIMRQSESGMMRAWLVPERSATESQQAGSRADSESHAQVGDIVANLTWKDILQSVNWHLVNPLLVYNYGPEAANTVRVKAAGLDPVLLAFYRAIVTSALTNPANVDLLLAAVNFNAMLDSAGLPKSAEQVDTSIIAARKAAPGAGVDPGLAASAVESVHSLYGKYLASLPKE